MRQSECDREAREGREEDAKQAVACGLLIFSAAGAFLSFAIRCVFAVEFAFSTRPTAPGE